MSCLYNPPFDVSADVNVDFFQLYLANANFEIAGTPIFPARPGANSKSLLTSRWLGAGR